MTNESGYYVVASLPPGFYAMTVEAIGFKLYVKTENKLDPNIAATVDANLEVGAVTERVEGVASPAQLQTESATVGKLVESEQIRAAVLNGRNPVFLALLKPGVRGPSLAGFSFGLIPSNFNINGARRSDSLITFDGAVGIRTRGNGTSIGVADLDAVQEIQVLTANYNAEYGRSSGGQIRMVTRSGSKEFHGSAYEYLRNQALDANTWVRNFRGQPREARRYNQFGYLASGPVYVPGRWNIEKNKLFFLWAEEWVRFRQELTSTFTVPSLAMRRGDFSELLNPTNPFFGRVQTVNDPDTGRPFPGNIIPADRLSPTGLALLRVYPEPTPGIPLGTANYFLTRPQPEDQRKDTLALDLLPVAKHTFRVRHQNFSYTQRSAFTGGIIAPADFNRPNKTASLHHIYTLGPSTTNEFLVTASVDRVRFGPRPGSRLERSRYGINYPYLFPERKQILDRIPGIAIANFQGLSAAITSFSSGPIYVIRNNTTKIAGAHAVKWGAVFERSGQNDFDQPSAALENGRFEFVNTRPGAPTTGLAIANAAMGLFNNYQEIGQRAYTPYRGQMFESFFQDSWKATPRLLVELGLRYTIQQPYYYSLWRNMAVFDPRRYDPEKAVTQERATGLILGGDCLNGVVIPGEGFPEAAHGRVAIADSGEFNHLFSGGSKTWGELQKLNFQPRIGVAYRIGGSTVARAGVGRFFARPGVSDVIALGANAPFQPAASITNGLADDPASGRPAIFPLPFVTSDPVYKIPSAYNWSITVERLIGSDTSISIAYVARIGLHMERQRNINQLPLATLRPENSSINQDVLRPYKGFASITLLENAARSEYNSLQLEWNRRFTRSLGYGLAYTWSRSFDNASDPRDIVYNAYDDRNYWGPSSFDTRHLVVLNVIYELPFLKDRSSLAGRLLGGWRITAVTQFQTGNPVTVGTAEDVAGIGSAGIQPWEVQGNPALARGERKFSQGAGDQNFFFRTRNADGAPIFTPPARGTFSTSQTRNSLPFYNPGFQNWNLALFKNFPMHETHTLQFRAEFFNWLNHPNWGPVSVDPQTGVFGKVTSKTGERNIQLALRYSF